ncbi:MAG: T9SS type A sorting domain-containing protein [Bacteroidetes bacterium]|nr:T9SS type A sorting domain-containing protein [Bacteroidota bacterium]
MATDLQGNIYATGYFKDSINLGAVTLVSSGDRDIFIAKYNSNGSLLWATKAGGYGKDEGYGITTTGNGVYVTGYCSSNSLFGGMLADSFGFQDIFIAKYDINGNIVWLKTAGTDLPDGGYKIKTNHKGHLFVTGHFGHYGSQPYVYKTAHFDLLTVTSLGNDDVFIAKYDTLGNAIWVKGGGTKTDDYSYGCSMDAMGNVYMFGVWTSPTVCKFDQVQINYFGTGFLLGNYFLVKYDSNGTALWGRGIGAYGSQTHVGAALERSAITVGLSGNIYITGSYRNCDVRFHDGSVLTKIGGSDVFTAKYNTNGDLLWAKKAGGDGDDESLDLSIDDNENSYITGDFGSPYFIFDNGDTLFKGVGYDLFVASYDSSGNVRWAKSAGGAMGSEIGNSIKCNKAGNEITVLGAFSGYNIVLDNITLNSIGVPTTFVAKLSTTTGIIDPDQSKADINIFPNPASATVKINSGTACIKSVFLYDYTGRIVYTRSVSDNPHHTSMDCSQLSEGIYFLNLETGKGNFRKKLMVLHR